MKALVTGGIGFIGSHVIDRLLEEHIEVIVLDFSAEIDINPNNKLIKIYQLDITDPRIEKVFAMESPDIVFHFAAQVSVANSIKNPIEDAHINIMGTIQLLKYAAKYFVKKIIFASSAAVYGTPEYLPVDEYHRIRPASFYGLSKVVAEKYIQLYSDLYNLDYCILRFSNVYGPRQSAKGEAGVISIFLQRLQEELPLIIYGDGTQTRDFIFVRDVANACIKAINLSGSYILNISSNETLSINDLVKILIDLSGKSIITNYQPSKPGDLLHSRLQNKFAGKILDWDISYSITAGLMETYAEAVNIK